MNSLLIINYYYFQVIRIIIIEMNIIQEDGPLKPFDISYREDDK